MNLALSLVDITHYHVIYYSINALNIIFKRTSDKHVSIIADAIKQ